jgi:hypothetical protein
MAPRGIFKVQERGETDLRDLARALRARGYAQIDPRDAMPKPGEFFVTKDNRKSLICCERKEDQR